MTLRRQNHKYLICPLTVYDWNIQCTWIVDNSLWIKTHVVGLLYKVSDQHTSIFHDLFSCTVMFLLTLLTYARCLGNPICIKMSWADCVCRPLILSFGFCLVSKSVEAIVLSLLPASERVLNSISLPALSIAIEYGKPNSQKLK
jgi:hypothetical protein